MDLLTRPAQRLARRLAVGAALVLAAALAPASPASAIIVVGPSVDVQMPPAMPGPWWTADLGTVTAHSNTSTVTAVTCTSDVAVVDVVGLGTADVTGRLLATRQGTYNFSCQATTADGGRGFTDFRSARVDADAPSLSPTISPMPVLLNGTHVASANAADTLSGLATAVCSPVSTVRLGYAQVTCTATDFAGNASVSLLSHVVGVTVGSITPAVGTVVRRGRSVSVGFTLRDGRGALLPDASAAALACGAQVTFPNGTVRCATYSPRTDRFTASWTVPARATLGAKPVTIAVTEGGAPVGSGVTSITVVK